MIYLLIGFMCSGKTTVGRCVAKKFGYQFIDLDNIIEKKQNKKIFQIFEEFGENYFRQLEHQTFKELFPVENNMIIAAGGGLLSNKDNYYLIKKCTTIFLDLPWRIIKIRLSDPKEKSVRPIAEHKTIKELYNLWQKRRKQYKKFANYTINVL